EREDDPFAFVLISVGTAGTAGRWDDLVIDVIRAGSEAREGNRQVSAPGPLDFVSHDRDELFVAAAAYAHGDRSFPESAIDEAFPRVQREIAGPARQARAVATAVGAMAAVRAIQIVGTIDRVGPVTERSARDVRQTSLVESQAVRVPAVAALARVAREPFC